MQTQEKNIQRAVANIRREAFRGQLKALKCDQRIHCIGGCSVMRLGGRFFIFGETRAFVDLTEATGVVLRVAALRGTAKPG